MLSPLHEALRWWVLRTPALHPLVLGQVGWSADRFEPDDPHVSTPAHPQMAVDAVLQLVKGGSRVGTLLYEVQLRPNRLKPFTWATYLGGAIGSGGRPALLGILTVDTGTASWAKNVFPDVPGYPFRVALIGPDQWEQWATDERHSHPGLQLIAWLCGRALDRLPAELSSHLQQCALLDMEDRSRYHWLLNAAVRWLPADVAEALMQQTKSMPGFFPMLPEEFAAYDRGEAVGIEQGIGLGREERDHEVRALLLDQLRTIAPDEAQRLHAESSVEVLIRALAAAAAH